MKLRPIGGKVLVRLHAVEEKTKSGIFVAASDKGSLKQGDVVSVGAGKMLENGTLAPVQVKVGERVWFKSYAPEELKVDGEELLILDESDILAVIE